MYTLTENKVTVYGTELTVYGMKSENLSFDKISCNKDEVQRLCKIFNTMDVAECHFEDIISEYLDDPSEFIDRFMKIEYHID